jgi:spore coat protein U-like protein
MHAASRLSVNGVLRLVSVSALAAFGAPQALAENCTVSTEAVLFDPYDPIGGAPADGVGIVRLRCDGAVPVMVGLAPGSGGSGRLLRSATGELSYELFADPARMLPWGDGTAAPARSASGPEDDLAVYGRIKAGQNVRDGIYTDSVTVILSF